MSDWERKIKQVRLGDEPYPAADIVCHECGEQWDDMDESSCTCEEEEEE